MKFLSTNTEILNKFKTQNSNVLNIRAFDIGYCLGFRNSNLVFSSEGGY